MPRLAALCAALLLCSRPAAADLSDDAFLEDLSRRAFSYFAEQADPVTGLVPDRARADGRKIAGPAGAPVASVAATGFGLTALCVGAERGWIPRAEARNRARATLAFLYKSAPQERGWFYHFMGSATGRRAWDSEASSIDTALLLAGALTAGRCFADEPEVGRLADALYRRVDFPWMLAGGKTLSMGWTPEKGFIAARWDGYSEHMILDLLGIGSRTHALPASEWYAWSRGGVVAYSSYTYRAVVSPLFIHQFPQAWLDLRGRRDKTGLDYFQNSVTATLAQRAFFQDLSKEIPTYSGDVWGLTASDGPRGYLAWGAPPRDPSIDGTVVPCAPAGSLMFTPKVSLAALRAMKRLYGGKAFGRYGFADAFNPGTGWVDSDVLGIDQGITLLSAENARGGAVWRWFMANPEIARAMTAAGFSP